MTSFHKFFELNPSNMALLECCLDHEFLQEMIIEVARAWHGFSVCFQLSALCSTRTFLFCRVYPVFKALANFCCCTNCCAVEQYFPCTCSNHLFSVSPAFLCALSWNWVIKNWLSWKGRAQPWSSSHTHNRNVKRLALLKKVHAFLFCCWSSFTG